MEDEVTKLTVFLTEDDRVDHQDAWKAVLERAREDGMAGACVWRGIEGFGRQGYLRSARFVDANQGLPVAVELIDDDERIQAFLAVVGRLVPGALVVRERVRISARPPASYGALDDPPPAMPNGAG